MEIGGATPTAAPPNMEGGEGEALEEVEVWEVEGALEEVPLIVAHSTIVEVEWEVALERLVMVVQSLRVAAATEVGTQRTAMEWERWVLVEVAVAVLATTVDTPTTTTATTATMVGCLATVWEGMEGGRRDGRLDGIVEWMG